MTETQKAQRKANSYKSPATFMDGFNYGLEISNKLPSTQMQIELNRCKQHNEYLLQQNVILISKLKEANDRLDAMHEFYGAKPTEFIDLDTIAKHVCDYYYINKSEIVKKFRDTRIRLPRQVVSYIAQTFCTGITLTMIGSYFNQDHTTHIHARRTIENLYKTDKNVKKAIDTICGQIFTNK